MKMAVTLGVTPISLALAAGYGACRVPAWKLRAEGAWLGRLVAFETGARGRAGVGRSRVVAGRVGFGVVLSGRVPRGAHDGGGLAPSCSYDGSPAALVRGCFFVCDEDLRGQAFGSPAHGTSSTPRKTLGRLATQIADVLRGKRKPTYTPHIDTGDFVIVVNAEKIA